MDPRWEIVSLGADGKPIFKHLLHRRGDFRFYAFDLLWLHGEDLRQEPLIKRKRMLKRIVPRQPSFLLYSDHIAAKGVALFERVCEMDLEGIVGKYDKGAYVNGKRTGWKGEEFCI